MHALDGNGPYVTDEDVRNIVDTIKGPILLRQGGAFLFLTQITQILTDLVASRIINNPTFTYTLTKKASPRGSLFIFKTAYHSDDYLKISCAKL